MEHQIHWNLILIISPMFNLILEIKENLFKEFFSNKGDSGTGLGLMVVDRIVKSHSGKIEVLTKPAIGSLFRTIFKA